MAPREDAGVPGRGPGDRLADHATIDRLAADLLPALVAQLGASGLGELEVREGSWRVRLRMPAEAAERARAVAGPGAGVPGHVQLTLPDPAAAAAVAAAPDAMVDSPAGERPPGARAARELPADGQDDAAGIAPAGETGPAAPRVVATSPAVGFFRPRPALAEGAALDAGAVLGSVDVLGVAQEVTAPAAGIVVRFFVEPGEPVEYGQEILEIGPPPTSAAPPAAVVPLGASASQATAAPPAPVALPAAVVPAAAIMPQATDAPPAAPPATAAPPDEPTLRNEPPEPPEPPDELSVVEQPVAGQPGAQGAQLTPRGAAAAATPARDEPAATPAPDGPAATPAADGPALAPAPEAGPGAAQAPGGGA